MWRCICLWAYGDCAGQRLGQVVEGVDACWKSTARTKLAASGSCVSCDWVSCQSVERTRTHT